MHSGEHSGLKTGMAQFRRNSLPPEWQFGRALCQISFHRNPPESAGMTGIRQESVGQGKDLLTTNESLRLVGGFLSPSALDAGFNIPQRVTTTRWGFSPTSHSRAGSQQPPTSLRNSLVVSFPLSRSTPAPATPTRDAEFLQPPTSHRDSLVVSLPLPPSTPAQTTPIRNAQSLQPPTSLRDLLVVSFPLPLRRRPVSGRWCVFFSFIINSLYTNTYSRLIYLR